VEGPRGEAREVGALALGAGVLAGAGKVCVEESKLGAKVGSWLTELRGKCPGPQDARQLARLPVPYHAFYRGSWALCRRVERRPQAKERWLHLLLSRPARIFFP
jgi:hypothetical protein